MLFNSYLFIFAFLPIVLLGWWVIFRRQAWRLAFLTIASYAFYSYFQFPKGLYFLPLLLASTTADYIAGRAIHASDDARSRKLWLIAALIVNLGLLAVFKYMGLFTQTLDALASAMYGGDVPITHLILPIGISFYTFNSMSYTIDIYRRRVEPAQSFLHYSTFVALFPHLIAGPIIRFSDLDAQLKKLTPKLTWAWASGGLFFFTCGLFKKLAIADNLAPTVEDLLAVPGDLTVVTGWIAAVGYSLQIYFDFSGYSDMAVGLAMLLGFTFPQNFNSPYKAANISELWRRWHMTLALWMRDYLFFTLGGSRGKMWRTLRNLMFVMMLVGLWHGAAWTFAIWGLGQGLLLSIHTVSTARNWPTPPVWFARLLTYGTFVLLAPFFCISDVSDAFTMTGAMLGANGVGVAGELIALPFLLVLGASLAWVNFAPNTWEFQFKPRALHMIGIALVATLGILLLGKPSPFLYFQF